MSTDITKAVFRKLVTTGQVLSMETFRSIKATYYRIALDFVNVYSNLSMMNGLQYDRHSEEQTVELFSQNIMTAGLTFMENPMETPFIPSWNRAVSAMPSILEQLRDAVEQDNRQYKP